MWKRSIRRLGIALSAGMAVALGAFAIYDLVEFQPRKSKIAEMIANADELDRSAPAPLERLIRMDHGGTLPWLVTRSVISEIDRGEGRFGQPGIARQILWRILIGLHLSQADQLIIDRSSTYLGKSAHGYASGAMSVYGKPLNQLNETELATLVVIARWPRLNRAPERAADVARAAEALVARVRTARRRWRQIRRRRHPCSRARPPRSWA